MNRNKLNHELVEPYKGEKRTKLILARVTPAEMQEVRRAAKSQGVSVSQFIRWGIRTLIGVLGI